MTVHLDSEIFNPIYLPLLNSTKKYNILYGGSGSGKSVFICQNLIIKAINSKRRILIIRKTLASQRDSCWELTKSILSQWELLKRVEVRKSEFQINFPNGSQMLFKGIDNPEKIKSITGITDCWTEEATELTEDDFLQLTLRLRSVADTQFWISFNPTSKASWVYTRWFAPDAKIDDDTVILKSTYKDNKFLPDDYIRTLENMIKINPVYYKIYAQGEFCTLDKLIYNNWRVEDFDYKSITGTRIAGLDFGYSNDINALTLAIATEDRKLYIYNEWGDTGKTNQEIASVIKQMGIAKDLIIADSAEPKSCEELRRAGLRIKESVKGADSINHGIQLLQEYEIIVHPRCVQTIEELENYAWQKDKKTGEYIDKPIDLFNHHLDSLRYAMQMLGKGKIRTNSTLKQFI